MRVIVQAEALHPYREIERYQAEKIAKGSYGAAVSFVGVMRDFNSDSPVTHMQLEHYPGMAEQQIEAVCHQAMAKWNIDDLLVIHRYGDIYPDDPIVVIAVWSTHRSEAFDACRYVINYLKQQAPFWKKEFSGSGDSWVASNSKDPALET